MTTAETEAPHPRPPERVWTVFAAYGAVWACSCCVGAGSLVVMLISFLSKTVGLDPEDRAALFADPASIEAIMEKEMFGSGFLASSMAAATTCTLGLALAAAALSKVPLRERLALGPPVWRPGYAVPAALAVMVAAPALATTEELVAHAAMGGLSDMLQQRTDAMAVVELPWYPLTFVSTALVAPVGEELLFRGYIQPRLVGWLGRWAGIIVTSVMFGTLHLDPMHVVFAFVAGVFLGWLRERTGSVRPSILAHIANNTIYLAMVGFGIELGSSWWPLAGAGALTLASIYALTRMMVPPTP